MIAQPDYAAPLPAAPFAAADAAPVATIRRGSLSRSVGRDCIVITTDA